MWILNSFLLYLMFSKNMGRKQMLYWSRNFHNCESLTWCHSFSVLLLCSWIISHVVSVSHVQLFVTPWTAAHQASLSFTISWSVLKLMSIESLMLSNHLILCHPLLLLPSIFPSIRVFSNESALHIRWTKYWSFSLSNCPCNEYSGLLSFRSDWLDLLAVNGLSRIFSKITAQKYLFFSVQPSFWSNSHIHTLTTGKNSFV